MRELVEDISVRPAKAVDDIRGKSADQREQASLQVPGRLASYLLGRLSKLPKPHNINATANHWPRS
jgi:hypothetical protein